MINLGSMYTRIEADTSGLRKAESEVKGFAGRIGPVLSGAFTIAAIGKVITDTTMASARLDTLGVVVDVVGRNAGIASDELDKYEESLRKSGISAIQSREALTKMIQAQIDLTKTTELARVAQNAAVIGNLDSSESFGRLIHGIRSAEVEILRNIGVNVSFEQSYKEFGKTVGKSAADLTEYEKVQARTNAVIKEGQKILGVYEAAMDTPMKKFKSLNRYVSDTSASFGRLFTPSFGVIVDRMTERIKNFQQTVENGNLDDFAEDIRIATQLIVDMDRAVDDLSETIATPGMVRLSAYTALFVMFGKKVGGVVTIVDSLNNLFEKVNKNFENIKMPSFQRAMESLSEYQVAFDNLMQVSSGQRDFSTGELNWTDELGKVEYEIKQLEARRDSDPGWQLFPDPAETKRRADEINAQIDVLEKRRLQLLGDVKDNWMVFQPPAPEVPEVDTPDVEEPPSNENWNAVREREISYLQAIEDKKLQIIQSSLDLEMSANEMAYRTGLTNYQTYLKTRQGLTEESIVAELNVRKKELADAQKYLQELQPVTDKSGKVKEARSSAQELAAMEDVVRAEQRVLDLENELKTSRQEASAESIYWAESMKQSYGEITAQALDGQGKYIEAEKLRQRLEEESLQRKMLEVDAIAGIAGAEEALAALRAEQADRLKTLEVDRLQAEKEGLLLSAELNNQFDTARAIQAEILALEIQRAELDNDPQSYIDALRQELALLEKMSTPLGAFEQTWNDTLAKMGDDVQIMADVAKDIACAMDDAFSDFFFDALEGKLDSFGEYVRSFVSSVNRVIADALSQKLVSKFITGEGGLLAGILHDGGVVGRDTHPMRFVEESVFAGARRAHQGLAPDEMPLIVKKDEAVLTPGQQQMIGMKNRFGTGMDLLDKPMRDLGPKLSKIEKDESWKSVSVTNEFGDRQDKRFIQELKDEMEEVAERVLRRHS